MFIKAITKVKLLKNSVWVIMNRKKISIIEKILICSVGIVLTFDGVVGFFSFINTRNYIHTVGVVEELDRKK